jgi:hypothetical protein
MAKIVVESSSLTQPLLYPGLGLAMLEQTYAEFKKYLTFNSKEFKNFEQHQQQYKPKHSDNSQ